MRKNKSLTAGLLALALAAAPAFTGYADPEDGESEVTVYVAGRYEDSACYWQNGTRVDLPAGDGSSYANAIAVTAR